MDYALPEVARPTRVKKNQVLLVASGDLRPAANRNCWASQQEMEEALRHAVAEAGYELVRAHPFQPEAGHGFIGSQKEGMEVFAGIDPKAPLIVAEAVWQYSHHVLHGLITHRGPILTVANWSGTWPGLVGMLNLNGSLTKAGVKYSTLWSEDFTDAFFTEAACATGSQGRAAAHRRDHVADWHDVELPKAGAQARRSAGRAIAARQSHHGRVRRRLHGHVQRHHPRPSAATRPASTRSGSANRRCITKRRKCSDDEARPSAAGWKSAA